jgi:hypothetical protein
MEGFEAFARALGSEVAELRGCLMATRDGRVLGVYPAGSTNVDAAWRRIAPLRACTSAVVRFERETWCVVGHGAHVAVAIVAISTDPLVVVERMELLLTAVDRASAENEPATIVLPDRRRSGDDRSTDDDEDVDRAALVQEFSGLLQEKRTAADG